MGEAIAVRVGELESKIDWMMTKMRMRAVVQSGVIDPHTGEPIGQQTYDGTMLELYNLEHGINREAVESDATKLFAEAVNGIRN